MAIDIVSNLRIAEDAILAIELLIVILLMFYAWKKLRHMQFGKIPLLLGASSVPWFVWKVVGAVRRIAIDRAADPVTYDLLHDFGEVFESISGLCLALGFIAIFYFVLKK